MNANSNKAMMKIQVKSQKKKVNHQMEILNMGKINAQMIVMMMMNLIMIMLILQI
jgi:hypothetical protein